VGAFAKTHEYRYVYNRLWYSEHTEVTLDCTLGGVTERDGWYEATVSCTGYSNTGGETNGTETVAPHHADWFTQTYVYSVKGALADSGGDERVARENWRRESSVSPPSSQHLYFRPPFLRVWTLSTPACTGCGTISDAYLSAGDRFDAYEITACADLDTERAEQAADEYGCHRDGSRRCSPTPTSR